MADIPRIEPKRGRRTLVCVASFVAMLATAWTSWACPNCPVGRAARQQAWEDGLATNLLIALVPFVLVGMVSLWAERIGKAH